MKQKSISTSADKLNKLRNIINNDDIIKFKCKSNDMIYQDSVEEFDSIRFTKNKDNENDKSRSNRIICEVSNELDSTYLDFQYQDCKEYQTYDEDEEKFRDNLFMKMLKGGVRLATISCIITLMYLIIMSLYFKDAYQKIFTFSRNVKNYNEFQDDSNVLAKSNYKSNYNNLIEITKPVTEKHNNSRIIKISEEPLELEASGNNNNLIVNDKITNEFNERVNVNTEFLFRTTYTSDGQVIEDKKWPGITELDITKEELAHKYPEWKMTHFSENLVIFERKLEGYASSNYYLLKFENGKINAYIVKENDELILRESLSVEEGSLEMADKLALEEGIYVFGEDKLIRKLEAYTS